MCEIMPVSIEETRRSSEGAGGRLLDRLELPEGGRAKYAALQGIIERCLENANDKEKKDLLKRAGNEGLLQLIFRNQKPQHWSVSNSQELKEVKVLEPDEGMPEAWREEEQAKKRKREDAAAAALRTVNRRVDWGDHLRAINRIQDPPRKMAPKDMIEAVASLVQLRPGCHGPLVEEHGAAHAPEPPGACAPAAARPAGAGSARARSPQE
ncbi:hypothetical protein T484DRAFT_1808663, partial [Baffinella frigidus]